MTTAGRSTVGSPALQALYEIAMLAAGGRNDPAAVARLAGEHASRLVNVEAAAVFAWDARAGLLQPIYETPSTVQEGPMRPGEGMVGRVFESQKPLVIDDYQTYRGALERSRGRGMGGAVAVPMVVAGRPIGVLGAWTYAPRHFTEEETQLFALFAAHVAPAFEAARVAAERDVRERTLHALHEVAVAAAAVHESNAVAGIACQRACDLLDAQSAYAMWYDPELDELRTLAGHGQLIQEPGWTIRPGEGIAGAAFQQRQPMLVEDYPNWSGALGFATKGGVRSMLAVPLVIHDRAVGAMAVSWRKPRALTLADVEALTLLAAQVAADLETMRLLESREQQVRSLTALHEVAVAASGVLDAAALAKLGVDRAREMLGVDGAVLRWWDADRGTLRLLASNDPQPTEHAEEVTPQQGVIGVAFRTRRHAILENSAAAGAGLPWTTDHNVATALGVPLMVGQQVVGAMVVATYTPHTYGVEEIRLLQLLASQLAPALEAARLAEERERHIRTVSVLASIAAKAGGLLDETAVGRLATEAVSELFENAISGIAVWDSAAGELVTIWDGPKFATRRLEPGEGALGQAFLTSDTVVVDDYPSWPHATARTIELGCRSVIAVPLGGSDGPVGSLAVRFFSERRISQEDVRLVQLIAAQITPSLAAARLHADLARTARRLRGLYDAMASGVCVFDREGTMLEINDAGLRIFGIERSQLDGRVPADVANLTRIDAEGLPSPRHERPFQQALRTGKPVHGSVQGYRRPDGSEFWVQFDAVPVFDAEGHVEQAISSYTDITALKAAEAARRESEAKSRFLASMSHELRTPLNSILGFAQLLDQQAFGKLNERQQRYVGHINASGQHLLDLVNDILDLSKVAAGQMDIDLEDVPIAPVVDEVLARLRPLADDRHLHVSYGVTDKLVARADKRRLEQVLFNLLSNAIKFTPERGSVALEARRRAKQVVISVKDTGPGIPEDQHARMFEEFTQLDGGRSRSHEGTGLGLPLTKRLVELMNGRLTLRSQPGHGSDFTFTLPVA